MIVDQVEATTKACPFKMDSGFAQDGKCRASACMAWRWAGDTGGGFCGASGVPVSLSRDIMKEALS